MTTKLPKNPREETVINGLGTSVKYLVTDDVVQFGQNGKHTWIENGQIHCVNGPAVVFGDGAKQWWLFGKFIRAQKD